MNNGGLCRVCVCIRVYIFIVSGDTRAFLNECCTIIFRDFRSLIHMPYRLIPLWQWFSLVLQKFSQNINERHAFYVLRWKQLYLRRIKWTCRRFNWARLFNLYYKNVFTYTVFVDDAFRRCKFKRLLHFIKPEWRFFIDNFWTHALCILRYCCNDIDELRKLLAKYIISQFTAYALCKLFLQPTFIDFF